MSDLRNARLAGWCGRCHCIVFVASTPAERGRLEALHDRTAHPIDTPTQTQFSREPVTA